MTDTPPDDEQGEPTQPHDPFTDETVGEVLMADPEVEVHREDTDDDEERVTEDEQ